MSYLKADDGLGPVLNREPERYNAFLAMGQHIMCAPSELSFAERELIATYVSALNACHFCYGTHSSIAKALGQDPALVDALVANPATAPIPDKLKSIFAYVRKLTFEPARLTQSDADTVYASGWKHQTLSDAVAVAAYFAMANRLADGHGAPGLPQTLNDAIGAQIAAAGGYPRMDELLQK
jgi:uncharacterized peroxidase-related enzyme